MKSNLRKLSIQISNIVRKNKLLFGIFILLLLQFVASVHRYFFLNVSPSSYFSDQANIFLRNLSYLGTGASIGFLFLYINQKEKNGIRNIFGIETNVLKALALGLIGLLIIFSSL